MQWLKLQSGIQRLCCRCVSSQANTVPHIAIVGSGPAGFYTAQQVFKGHPGACVDIFEKLPVPYGLVRFGVAPDHPEVKNVIHTFQQTAKNERCTFLGNVTVGRDVSLEELRRSYTAVVLAYGADEDKTFGIPGEDLRGVYSARSFVGWYNGLPQDSQLSPYLDTDTCVVLGQGNVAVDVARMLLTPVDILRKTDITEHALEALSRSRVKRVHLVGRRGPLQVAFTTAELREMLRLPQTKPVLNPTHFIGTEEHLKELPRPRKRLTELMMKAATGEPSAEDASRWKSAKRSWHLQFLRSPLEVLSDADGASVRGVSFSVNKLEGPFKNQVAVPTGDTEDLECGLVLRSIGYRSIPLESQAPFDDKGGVVPNSHGRVSGNPGLYCSGWVKRGPVGVIVSTMNDAFETGKLLNEDLHTGVLPTPPDSSTRDALITRLAETGMKAVSFADWRSIDEAEILEGEQKGKPREKVVSVTEMLSLTNKS